MRPLSLAAVQDGEMPEVPRDLPVYLVCELGHFSELVGLHLELAGFRDVRHLPGGFRALAERPRGPKTSVRDAP
jgi:rhodanese-related sulfurtransferase